MKNLLVILCTALASVALSQSSSEIDSRFTGFVGGGFNASQIAGDLMQGYRKFGANLFVGTYINWHPKFSNSLEIGYSMKGSRSDFSDGMVLLRKYNLDYAQVNFLFNYHDKKVATFQGGISMGRTIRSNYITINSIGIKSNPDPIYNNFSTWDGAILAGVIFNIKERFGVGMRGAFSMNNLFRNKGPYVNSYGDPALSEIGVSRARNSGLFNNTLSFRFYYFFIPK